MDNKESFGAEIGKQIPIKEIYNDLAHPTLSTVGQTLQGATRIALTPISALIWGYDKISAYLDIAIPEYFAKRKVQKEKVQTPDPSIAVPTIVALQYTAHKPELRVMFTNLLGASMNKDTCNDGHPAFVEIIKQLTPDECKILRYLATDSRMPMIKIREQVVGSEGQLDTTPYFSDIVFTCECSFPSKFPEYLNNLSRLGLIDVFYDTYLTDDTYYAQLRSNPHFPVFSDNEFIKYEEKKSMYELSQFGKEFCKICIQD